MNEWRQNDPKLGGREYLLEPLSDVEIHRLLDCLSKHGELNRLEHLDREMQYRVIKEKHGKELLVAMREATEDRSFDAILEDEFRGIDNRLAQKMYLTVCCFYQHGGYIRDTLLAELIEMPLVNLYPEVNKSLEGVLMYEAINEVEGEYAVRARHRIIAEIVWERCGDPGTREDILQRSLSAMNLNYRADKEAFENFVRSDKIIDAIRSLDGKTRFFEEATRKDPSSPYVRQHYARMLLRENKPELALSQIQGAIEMSPKNRIFYHTQGVIYSQLTLKVESQGNCSAKAHSSGREL